MASEWTVGRNPDCDIRLQNPSVSRRHISIRAREDSRYEITDLGSSGGTFVESSGRWRRVKRDVVAHSTPIMLGEYATSVAELIGRPTAQKAVFVSYASDDRESAYSIAAFLEARGISCWIAPRDVRPGHDYGEEIIRGIETANSFVLVHSSAANRSTFVKREVERAVSKGKPMFPVRIENVAPSPGLELFVSTPQWIDAWSGALDDHLEHLLEILVRTDPSQTPTAYRPPPRKKVDRRTTPRPRRGRRLAAVMTAVLVLAVVVGAGLFLAPQYLHLDAPSTAEVGTDSQQVVRRGGADAVAGGPAAGATQVVDGVSVVLKNIVLSSDKRTIIANLSLTNTTEEAVLVMIADLHNSTFIIPAAVDDALVRTKGIASCGLETGICLRQPDRSWSRLEPSRPRAASIYSTQAAALDRSSVVGVNIRVLVKRGEEAGPYDVSFDGVTIE